MKTEKKDRQEIEAIPFDISQLNSITFGRLEGERDPLLKDCFFPTRTVQRYLKTPYNYVLSPKGAGKSALFRSISDKYLNRSQFKYEKFAVIQVNEAFGFNDGYLDVEKFHEDSRMRLTISWALYILIKIIQDITTNRKDLTGYDELLKEIKKIPELKGELNLYNLRDFLKSISTAIKFTANGQEFEVAPQIKLEERTEKLVLNKIYKEINDFYKKNDLTAFILIDRIDNFVQKEEYQLQRKYIQGLFDCIEEISLNDSILPTMFLRTDLFYSYESDVEYDKVKDRTIELQWDKGETLNFLVYRLNHNEYITLNFRNYLVSFLNEARQGKHRVFKEEQKNIWQKFLGLFSSNGNVKSQLDTNRPFNYTVSDKYLKMFFPEKVNFVTPMDFCEWIFEYLKDANSFVNPRLLIYFFNKLIEQQVEINIKFYPDKKEVPPTLNGDCIRYNLFSDEAFDLTFKKVQQDELKNIFTIIKKKEFQDLFKIINLKSFDTGFFRYGDINIKKLEIDKELYESLLKYLKLLGFCVETEKQKYEVPHIYRAKLELL